MRATRSDLWGAAGVEQRQYSSNNARLECEVTPGMCLAAEEIGGRRHGTVLVVMTSPRREVRVLDWEVEQGVEGGGGVSSAVSSREDESAGREVGGGKRGGEVEATEGDVVD